MGRLKVFTHCKGVAFGKHAPLMWNGFAKPCVDVASLRLLRNHIRERLCSNMCLRLYVLLLDFLYGILKHRSMDVVSISGRYMLADTLNGNCVFMYQNTQLGNEATHRSGMRVNYLRKGRHTSPHTKRAHQMIHKIQKQLFKCFSSIF